MVKKIVKIKEILAETDIQKFATLIAQYGKVNNYKWEECTHI